MAAFSGKCPPHTCTRKLLEFFDSRDFSKKSVFSERLGYWVVKNEIILEKFRFYMVRFFFWPKKSLFQMGILGILGQTGHIRPQKAPKQAKIGKNGQNRPKTYFSDDVVPPCSLTALHTFCRHVRTFPGHTVAVSTIFSIFLTHFRAFLGHFWPFLAIFGMPCFGHFWPFWSFSHWKKGLFWFKKKPDHVGLRFFQNYFIFSRPPTESLAKNRLFWEISRIEKIEQKGGSSVGGGIM